MNIHTHLKNALISDKQNLKNERKNMEINVCTFKVEGHIICTNLE